MKAILFALLVIAVLVGAGSAVIFVHETEYAIVVRFGNPIRTIVEPGLNFKYPFPIERTVRYDRRLMVMDIPVREEPPREFLTLDKKNIEVSSYTCWKIVDPLRFLETVGSRAGAEAYLGDIVVSELGKVLGRHDLIALISVNPEDLRLAAMTESIHQSCAETARAECGVEIIDFGIKRINFPEQNRSSVFERMRAERKQIATRYRSEGEQLATGIRAEANRERMEILADAQRQATEIEGRAEAEATRIYNEAYGQNREFYEFLRTLESYEKTLNEGTTILLPPEMEYLKLLADPDHSGIFPPSPESRARRVGQGAGR